MSVIDGLSDLAGGGDEGPDYWAVRRMKWNGDGGFREFSDEWAQLDEPVDRETFEWNTGELEPGRYRLMAIKDTKVRRPDDFDVQGWTIEVGEPDGSRSTDDQLEQKVDMLLAQQEQRQPGGDGEVPLMELVNDPADLFVLMGAFNEDFVGTFGEQAALKQLGLIGGNELGFDDYKDNPIGAFFFDSYKEPQQLRELGQNLGAGGSAFVDGLLAGAEDPEAFLSDEIEEAERRAEAAEDRDPQDFEPRAADSGPTTLDEMGIDKPDPTEVAQALGDSRGAAAPAQDGQGGVEAGAEGVGPSKAGAGEEPDLDASAGAEGDGTNADDSADEAETKGSDTFDVDLTDDDIAAAMEDL